jgi:hypothetical protein
MFQTLASITATPPPDAGGDHIKPGIFLEHAMSLKKLNEQEITDLIHEALTEACFAIQTKIGQTDGGVAGVFFSGEHGDQFNELMGEYIKYEYSMDEAFGDDSEGGHHD